MGFPQSGNGYQRWGGGEACCVPGGKANANIAQIVGETNQIMARLELIAIKDKSFNHVAGAYDELARHRCEIMSELLNIAAPDECPVKCVEEIEIPGFKSVRVSCDSES